MVFKKLPEEAQTVIVDFAYQYGLSDTKGSIRQTFWKYVYAGEWQKLADWLLSKPDPYSWRRKREGDAVQFGIENDYLPEFGDPCSPASQGGGSITSLGYEQSATRLGGLGFLPGPFRLLAGLVDFKKSKVHMNRACPEFCVNGPLAGNCRLVRRHHEHQETRRT